MNANFTTNKILIDYFSFTIRDVEAEDIITMLGLDGVAFIDNYGSKGYHHRYYYDGVSILFGGREEVWCEMSGQGCRVYETYGNNDWFGLAYQILVNDNAHMTRIDIAYDDFNGLLDLDKIRSDVYSGNWVSRCQDIIETSQYRRTGFALLCVVSVVQILPAVFTIKQKNVIDKMRLLIGLDVNYKSGINMRIIFCIIYLLMIVKPFMVWKLILTGG